MRPEPGDVIGGKYRIGRMIGDGGMGAVYEARHEVLGSQVALKFLHAELAKRPGLASRFLQEAKVSASIQSAHVTRVTDVDQTPDGSPYLVMELLTGESLQQLLDRRVTLPRDQAVDFALQILAGLEAAHALGVVHRDLKPDNVFITPSTGGPVVKLLDFGIAKLRETNEYKKGLTRPGAVMGTPEYMAPEQFYSADRVDHRADIYSLGAMLYEMLCGKRPAYGDDTAAIIAEVAQGRVPRVDQLDPAIPRALADVVHKAMAPIPGDRFATALDMRMALAPLSGELSHAGRLAATPAPGTVRGLPDTDPLGAPPATVDGPALTGATHRGVPPTLPPDDSPTGAPAEFSPKGSTQEAPRDMIQALQRAQQPSAPYVTPGPSMPSYAAYGSPPRRKRSRLGGALIALLLGALVTGGVIAVVAMRQQSQDEPPPLGTTTTGTPATTITAQGGTEPAPTQTPAPTPVAPTPAQPTAHPTASPTHPPATHADGGATVADAGVPQFPFPMPFPSTIPTTLPSAFPQIPFPQIPGFPGPAPAPSH